MATKTIHKLQYQLLVDSSQFEKGMVASRKELNFAKREMHKLLTPAEKMEVRLEKLGNLAKKDAKFQGLYNRALREGSNQMRKTGASAHALSRGMIAAVGAYVSVATVRQFTSALTEQLHVMDDIAKAATNIGTTTEFLSTLEFITGKTAGFNEGQAIKAIEKMARRLGQAAMGTGEAQTALEKLSLSAKLLIALGPEQSYFAIADAMRDITNDAERQALALKLFDDEQAGIHTTMKLTTKEYEKQRDILAGMNGILKGNEAKKAEQAVDELDEIKRLAGGAKKEAAIRGTGAISTAAGLFRGIAKTSMVGFGNTQELTDSELQQNIQQLTYNPFRNFARSQSIREGFLGRREARIPSAVERMQRLKQDEQSEKRRKQEKSTMAFHVGMEKAFSAFNDTLGRKATDETKGRRGAITSGIHSMMGLGARIGAGAQDMLGNTHIRLPGEAVQNQPGPATRTTGPMDSIAAGSSAAFKLMHQTTSTESVKLDLAKKTADSSVKTVTLLEQMTELMGKNRWEQKEYQDNETEVF